MNRFWSNFAVATVLLGLVAAVPAGAAGHEGHGAGKGGDRSESCKHRAGYHDKVRGDVIRELYNDLVFPTPNLILSGQKSVANIFDSTVVGRVTPVGQFHDAQMVTEYFFALASTPTSKVTQVKVQSLLVDGSKVAIEVDIHFERTTGGPMTLRQTGFFTFNEQDRVVSFDLAILNLGAAVNPTSDAEREGNIQGVCAVLTLGVAGLPPTCPTEYTGFPDCVAFMHSIPYGTWDRANSNTVVCRQLHTLLTPYRPDVHCPHAGKTGGGACIDFTYGSFFDNEF
jgi:SnoaL-like domain